MTITLQAVNELIASLESAGELSIKERKYLELAKAYQQLAAENVGLALENVAMKQIVDYVTNLDNEPQYHAEGMGCGLEDRGITDRYDACRYGWGEAMERIYGEVIPCAEELDFSATDRIVAGIKADGVEEFLKGSQLPYQIATVLADRDGVDDATLSTVIWSGQPPEPDGDVWHIEYVSRGYSIVLDMLKQLREGAK
ncbi:hypothetical protein [Klebsiella variicola]|uniref:hypothetical protein n=1 Tax=Klebsiella variicola TaxID=244366 RepID=UPI0013D4CE73|nr:hypothetical protein [Klebsiella variicola]